MINDANASSMAEYFPNTKVKDKATSGKNPHWFMHNSRKFMEQDAFFELSRHGVRSVLDVGGSVNRASKVASKFEMSYHSSNPILETQDVVRNAAYPPELFCTNKAQDCNCTNPDALLLVHSIYYFEPQEFALMLLRTKKRIAAAVFHHFPKASGTFPTNCVTEATYKHIADGKVEMRVYGNSFAYVHSDLGWLQQNGYHFNRGSAKYTLCWTEVKNVQGMYLYKFVISAGHIPLGLSSFHDDNVLASDLTTMKYDFVYQHGNIVVDKIFGSEFGAVTVSPSVYAKLRLKFVGRETNKSLYGAMMAVVRNEDFGVSSEVAAHTVGVALLHNAYLYNEVQLGLSEHVELLTTSGFLNPVRPNRLRQFMVKVILFFSHFKNLLLTVFIIILYRFVQRIMGSTEKTNKREKVNFDQVVKWRVDQDLVLQEWNERAKNTGSKTKWMKSIPPFTEDKKSEMVIPFIVCQDVGMSNIPSSCDENRLSALLHRLISGNEKSTTAQVQFAQRGHNAAIQHRFLPTEDYALEFAESFGPIKDIEEFVRTDYGRKNDVNKVNELMRFSDMAEREDCDPAFYVEWFVKGENAPQKFDSNKLRGIFIPAASFNACAGPSLYWITKCVVSFTQRDESRLVITAGLDSPAICRRAEKFIDTVGDGSLVVWIDQTSFEANQTEQQNDLVFDYYERLLSRLGCKYSKRIRGLMKKTNKLVFKDIQRFNHNRKSWGKVAERRGGLPSGIWDVTARNSIETIVSISIVFLELGIPLEAISGFILGDDNLLFIPSQYRGRIDKSRITKMYDEFFGWKAKVDCCDMTELPKAEFCSCYFSRQEDGTVTLSPKAGKIFPKSFFLDSKLKAKPTIVYGMLCGFGHFPTSYLLSHLVNILVEKCAEMGIKAADEKASDWMWHPFTCSGEVSMVYSIEEDCIRYGVGEEELREMVESFRRLVSASSFPHEPLIIPSSDIWHKIIHTDLGIEEDKFYGDRREKLTPDRNEIALHGTSVLDPARAGLDH